MFETKSVKEIEMELSCSSSFGLSKEEINERQVKYGYNKLEEKKKKPLILVFLSQFNDPMIYVLLAAALISIGIAIFNTVKTGEGDWADPIIIMGVVVLNSIIGTVQESKAEKSLEALKKLSSPTCNVKRDNEVISIKAEELVPGDLVILEEGQTIPADIRLTSSSNLRCDESSLTGESLPIEKDANYVFTSEVPLGDRTNMVYMSTPIVYGHGEGIVTSTGMKTEIGKIAKVLSDSDDDKTPLQKKLASLSKFLGFLVLGIVVVIFIVELIQLATKHGGIQFEGVIDTLMLSISVAVAAIPEGLPAVVTIVLSLGVQKMAKANTIVRKLPSVETLGAVSVVCSDKTGTLTQNKMTVVETYILNSHLRDKDMSYDSSKILIEGMALCSNAEIENGRFGDPTEIALVDLAYKFGIIKSQLENKNPRIDELPFDSNRKMMSTLNKYEGKKISFTKGSIDSILIRCNSILDNGKVRKIKKEDIETINDINNDMSNRALRVLALAYKESDSISEEDMIFVGLVAMIDPPRPEAKPAVLKFKEAGIRTIMITGDHKITALAIAKSLGISDENGIALSGQEIDKLSNEELQEKVKICSVFARVSPENKVQIVSAIKANGCIAAMTGDGVNDAPSLKTADIGIAMGITGTDVAKGAAEMVLTDDNFASIEKAVEEGRGIFTNIRKTVLFLLSSNIAEVLTMFITIVLGFETPLLAIHILWVNLVTDSLPAVALGADEKDDKVMEEKPRNPKESLFAHGGYAFTFGFGAVITLITILGFLFIPFENGCFTISSIKAFLEIPSNLTMCQTMAFAVLSFSELFHMLGLSANKRSFFATIFKKKNFLLTLSFFLGIALTLGVMLIPGINTFFKCFAFYDYHLAIMFGFAIVPLLAHELIVLIRYISKKCSKKEV